MATAASLAGVEQYGLRWKAKVKLDVPNDIPSLLDNCDTAFDRILFAHNTVTRIIFTLNRYKNNLPFESLEKLDEIIERLEDSFVYEDIEAVASWDS